MKREEPIPPFGEGRTWRDIYDHLRQRHNAHEERVLKRHTRYKRMAAFFNVLIPLVALILTIVATSDIPLPYPYRNIPSFALATALTILTTLNSILEPSKKYSDYATLGVKLHDWLYDLETQMENLSKGCEDAERLKLLSKKNYEMSHFGLKMIGLDIPGAGAVSNLG